MYITSERQLTLLLSSGFYDYILYKFLSIIPIILPNTQAQTESLISRLYFSFSWICVRLVKLVVASKLTKQSSA